MYVHTKMSLNKFKSLKKTKRKRAHVSGLLPSEHFVFLREFWACRWPCGLCSCDACVQEQFFFFLSVVSRNSWSAAYSPRRISAILRMGMEAYWSAAAWLVHDTFVPLRLFHFELTGSGPEPLPLGYQNGISLPFGTGLTTNTGFSEASCHQV
jgi:hypothetical protein